MKKETILIVDDNESLREILIAYLKKDKYEVVQAENGIEAIKRLQKDKSIGLVLMDMMMPEMSGDEFLEKIKKYKSALGISICMITAVGDTEAIFKALVNGADDYMVKPIERDVLLEKISSFMKQKSTGQFFRLKMDLEGELVFNRLSSEIKIKDLSEGDLGFTSTCEIELGKTVGVRATFMDANRSHEGQTHLVRIYAKEAVGRGNFLYHASFIAPEVQFTNRIRSFVMLNKAEQEKEKLLHEQQLKEEQEKVALMLKTGT